MFKNLKVNNEIVTLGKESEKIENLFIHVSDYGDAYFDLCLCQKSNEKIFGRIGWCVIHIGEIENKIKELSEITGINEIRKEKIKHIVHG